MSLPFDKTSSDGYEYQLLYLIAYYKKEIKKAKREIQRIIERNKNYYWSNADDNLIAKWRENVKELDIKINQTWVCLNHYRSLIGIKGVG